MEEMEIKHVSRKDHPLMLIQNEDGESMCSWCEEGISLGESRYGCIECGYFMHKTCAQIEPVIPFYLHLQHDHLILSPHDKPWLCDVCGDRRHVTGFRYKCSSCLFSACIKCCVSAAALKDAANIKFQIEGHPNHTLALQLRHAPFPCDACHTDDKDFLYQCKYCPFWIHKTCATLASNILSPHHPRHPLFLAYGLPERFYNFQYKCQFCKVVIHGSRWVYHCPNCRYFAHIKCLLHADQQPSLTLRDGLGTREEANDHDLLHFPMSEAFNEPLKLLHSEKRIPDDEINHWSHHHPLVLNVKPQGNINHGDPIIICYGCVRPLNFPCYKCKDGCGFFLHSYCAEFPRTLNHELHAHHSLDLIDFDDPKFTTYVCSGCDTQGNTFVYRCEICKSYLDVNCAFLPNTIKHEAYKHPLVQDIKLKLLCDGCHRTFDGISYLCKACDFQLDMYCALRSPYSLPHRYCKGHEVPLTYPPVEDHLEDFYCTICETEMNPNFWLYHCNTCDNSFHGECIRNRDWYGNCLLEGTVRVTYHKHPLTYVRRKKTPRYVCFGCNHDISGSLILECRTATCPYRICRRCHVKNLGHVVAEKWMKPFGRRTKPASLEKWMKLFGGPTKPASRDEGGESKLN